MIEGLKPYAEYKESGLPWLNTVPKHWDMAPNRALMRDQRQVVGSRASDYTLLSLTLRGVIARDMVNPKGKFPAQFNTYKVVKPDDFVFCLFDIDETPRGVGLSPLKGMITGAYDVFSPTPRINPRFLYHYYLFVDEGKLMKPLYTGLRKTIQRGVFASLKAPLPPPDEQAAIVRFLDHANRKIDGFIRAKRKLIGLLNEQKQAIIHRAVTGKDKVRMVKDENGNSPFILQPSTLLKKPSGIPWLGDIPQHWEVLPIMRVFSEVYRYPTYYDINYVKSGVPEVRGEALVNGEIIELPDQRFITKETNARFRRTQLKLGDLVMSVRGTMGKIGVVGQKHVGANITANLLRLSPRAEIVYSQFLSLLMRSAAFLSELNRISPQTTIKTITMPQLASIRLGIPPLSEQELIVKSIVDSLRGPNTAIARTEREIALMQEYRTRLTADLVTGKLDVREAAAKLPDLPTDTPDEPLEELEPEEVEA